MKKRLLTLALALILCLSLFPMAALAAAPTVQTLAATNVTATSATLNGKVTNDGGTAITEYDFILRWYEGKYEMTNRYESDQETTFVINGDGTFSFNVTLQTGVAYDYRAYARNGGTGTDVAYGEWVKVVDGGAAPTTPPSGNDPWSKASSWAVPELQKAQSMGLIPATLNGKDFTAPVSRAEFAAISVKLYENLSGKTATAPAKNPFTDTNDPEVLKAYNVGLTAGTAADKFSPNDLLTREQAATMLTRVYKAATISGWTLATDGNFPLKYTKPAAFADDAKISDWAKDSVYFMVSKGIISGTGNNNFSPRATTSAEQASSYGTATREQALAIAVREVDNLKGTTPEVGAPTTPTQPTTPPNSGDTSIVGTWESGAANYTFSSNGTWSATFKLGVMSYGIMIWMPNEEYRGTYKVSDGVISYSGVEKRSLQNGGGSWQSTTFTNDYYKIGRDPYYDNSGECLVVSKSPITVDPFTGSVLETDGIYMYSKWPE